MGPSKHYGTNKDGSIHESKQSETQDDGTWGRTSSDHHDDGSITNVHVTTSDSGGNKDITDIPTDSWNVGDQYGNFDD